MAVKRSILVSATAGDGSRQKPWGRLRYEKNALRLGDLQHLHPAAVCHHGHGIQWVFRVPALHHGGKGAHQRPDLLPGHPAVRGVLSVHAGHRVLLPEGLHPGGHHHRRSGGWRVLSAVQRGRGLSPVLRRGGHLGGELRPGLHDSRVHPHQPLVLPAPGPGPEHLRLRQRHRHHRPASCDHRPGGEPVHGHHLPDRGRGHLSPGSGDLPGPAEPAGGQRPAPLRPDPGPGGCGPGLCQPGPPAGDDPPDVAPPRLRQPVYGGPGQPRLLPPVGAVYL